LSKLRDEDGVLLRFDVTNQPITDTAASKWTWFNAKIIRRSDGSSSVNVSAGLRVLEELGVVKGVVESKKTKNGEGKKETVWYPVPGQANFKATLYLVSYDDVTSPILVTEGPADARKLFLSHVELRRLAVDQWASGDLFSGVKSALEDVGLGWYVHEENAPEPQQPPTATTTTAPMPNTDNDPNDDAESGEESDETAKKNDSLNTRSQSKGAAQSDTEANLCQQIEMEAAAFLLITST